MRRIPLRDIRKIFLDFPQILKLIAVFAVVSVFLIASIAGLQFLVFRNTGIVKSIDVGIYWDVDCSSPIDNVSGIDWGMVEPGEERSVVVYVRNEGNAEVTLAIQAINWIPLGVEHHMSLTNDYQSQLIGVDEVMPITLLLYVSSEISQTELFSFDVSIEAVG